MSSKSTGSEHIRKIARKYHFSEREVNRMLGASPREWRNAFKKAGGKANWWDIYSIYLHSRAWRTKRKQVFRKGGRRCAQCGARPRILQVHHKTYERVGNERLSDLEALCKSCHTMAHK